VDRLQRARPQRAIPPHVPPQLEERAPQTGDGDTIINTNSNKYEQETLIATADAQVARPRAR